MGVKFNVNLDNEQMNEIASITADKVLATVEYFKNNEEWYERQIKDLEFAITKRDSLLVQKDLYIERLKETIRRLKTQ